jgi:hypothetical protein
MERQKKRFGQAGSGLPTAKNEDVEFDMELADADDIEALERAEEADHRQEQR